VTPEFGDPKRCQPPLFDGAVLPRFTLPGDVVPPGSPKRCQPPLAPVLPGALPRFVPPDGSVACGAGALRCGVLL